MDTFCPTLSTALFTFVSCGYATTHPWFICLIQINVPSTEFFNRPGRREAALNFKQKPHQKSKAVGGVLVPTALP
jgi:hypothetical protein